MGFQIEKIWMTIMVVAICLSNGRIEAQVKVGFYSGSCPTAELIIQEEVEKALTGDPGVGADLLRMFFHDCFASVRGAQRTLNTRTYCSIKFA